MVRGFFQGRFTEFLTRTIPGIFTGGWDTVVSLFTSRFIRPFLAAWFVTKGFFQGRFTTFFTETIPGIFGDGWDAVVGIFTSRFITPFLAAWNATRGFFQGDFVRFFTQTIPGIFKTGWDTAYRLFVNFANSLVRGMNTLIQALGGLPIPRVSVGVRYVRIGKLRVAYPTFSVSTGPLSSYVSLPQIPTIGARPTATSVPDSEIRRLQNAPGGNNPAGTTNNYYSLAANDFAREIERIVNAPGAQARAVGAP